MNETFELKNEPHRPKRHPIETNPRSKQKVLFAGMDCLPGQLDLFPTDGQEADDSDDTSQH